MFDKLCGALARTNGHQPCRQPAMKNGRCRLHGGKSTGPKTPAGLLSIKKSRTKHGRRSANAINEALGVREFIRQSKGMIQSI